MSSLRDQLQSIYEARGRLTPKILVDEARDPAHPLHSRFEWDNDVAAERYREAQAGELIRSVKISYRATSGRPASVNAFQSVRRPSGPGYEPVEEVIQDEFTTKILLADMERDWRAFKARYEGLAGFIDFMRQQVA